MPDFSMFSCNPAFLVGSICRLRILYHCYMEWNICISWSCFILLRNWHGRYIFKEFTHFWILFWYYMDWISFESLWFGTWYWADEKWYVFGYCSLSLEPDFLETMLYCLDTCWDLFLYDKHRYHCYWLSQDVEKEQFVPLQDIVSESWSWGSNRWRLAFNIRMTWTLGLCELIIHLGRIFVVWFFLDTWLYKWSEWVHRIWWYLNLFLIWLARRVV